MIFICKAYDRSKMIYLHYIYILKLYIYTSNTNCAPGIKYNYNREILNIVIKVMTLDEWAGAPLCLTSITPRPTQYHLNYDTCSRAWI